MAELHKALAHFVCDSIAKHDVNIARETAAVEHFNQLCAKAEELFRWRDLPAPLPAPSNIDCGPVTIVPQIRCTWEPEDSDSEDDEESGTFHFSRNQVELVITLHGCYLSVRTAGVQGPARFFDNGEVLAAELCRAWVIMQRGHYGVID